MNKSDELEALFSTGQLGEMLEREFRGKIGRTETFMKDCEFMMEFESEEKTPTAEAIKEKVEAFYASRGFEVEMKDSTSDSCLAIIHHDRSGLDWNAFVVNITTSYPLGIGGKKNYLRTTCSRL